jgi:hypothetical protein
MGLGTHKKGYLFGGWKPNSTVLALVRAHACSLHGGWCHNGRCTCQSEVTSQPRKPEQQGKKPVWWPPIGPYLLTPPHWGPCVTHLNISKPLDTCQHIQIKICDNRIQEHHFKETKQDNNHKSVLPNSCLHRKPSIKECTQFQKPKIAEMGGRACRVYNGRVNTQSPLCPQHRRPCTFSPWAAHSKG